MIGVVKYTEASGMVHSITTSGTDHEFVLHCGAQTAASNVRGGNHGDYTLGTAWNSDDSSLSNDRLLDITFYDGKNGDAISLNTGESVTVNGLRIVMHNNIYELDYKQENVLINVEKSYLYNGYDIFCDSRLYMAQDVNFEKSNSCMLPISKTYGNRMMLYNVDGTTTYAATGLVGSTAKPMITGFNANKVELWGENNPQYHMTVEILNPDGQMISHAGSDGYIRLWDMNTSQNKVYFTLFTLPRTLKWGTELNFKNKWSFSVQDSFTNPDREPDVKIGIK